jgi:hypothetical protein
LPSRLSFRKSSEVDVVISVHRQLSAHLVKIAAELRVLPHNRARRGERRTRSVVAQQPCTLDSSLFSSFRRETVTAEDQKDSTDDVLAISAHQPVFDAPELPHAR